MAAHLTVHTQRSGVYGCLRGPEYQTRAETRLLEHQGVDAVGMSTVLEALALHQTGVLLGGLSVVSDLSFSHTPTDPALVVQAAASAGRTVARALQNVLGMPKPPGQPVGPFRIKMPNPAQ